MRISKDRLAELGYNIQTQGEYVTIYPTESSDDMRNLMLEVCDELDFDSVDTDHAIMAMHKIRVLSALRKVMD